MTTRCTSCEPDYCACHDYFESYRKYKRNTMTLKDLQDKIFIDNTMAGWWDGIEDWDEVDKIIPTKLLLIHSEISEAMEGHRKGLMDDKLPHRKMMEVELADALIRILDLAGACGYDLEAAVAEKMEYNASRADHKHKAEGGKKY